MLKYSIIVPVYNAKSYIESCVGSILSQTVDNFEIILIDDGSTDGSGTICDALARSHSDKIRAYHTENRGVSAARNYGLDMAKGEYICFVDADDMISPFYIETAEHLTASDTYDVMIMHGVWSRKELSEDAKPSSVTVFNNNDLKRLWCAVVYRTDSDFNLPRKPNCNVVTAKIYRLELLNERSIRFKPGIKIAEDKLFNFNVFREPTKTAYADNGIYYVRRNSGSATQRYMKNCFSTNMKALLEIYRIISSCPDTVLKTELNKRYACALFAVERNCLTIDYCNKNNPNSFSQRRLDFEHDFRSGEIYQCLSQCDRSLLTPYEEYLSHVFDRSFTIINTIMKQRVIRIFFYFIYKVLRRIRIHE